MGIFLYLSLKGILVVKKKNYEKNRIIRIVIDFPVHGVCAVLSIPLVIKWNTVPILLQSLYDDLYWEHLFEHDRAPSRHNHVQGGFIIHFSVYVCFPEKVILSYQKMQVIKVTILSKNEVKIWKIHKKYKKRQNWQNNDIHQKYSIFP